MLDMHTERRPVGAQRLKPFPAAAIDSSWNQEGIAMPTTKLPEAKEKAAEISRKITNKIPLKKRDKDAPEGQVTGGFNQKTHQERADQPRPQDNSATKGDGQ
jgi:hypothetical protein